MAHTVGVSTASGFTANAPLVQSKNQKVEIEATLLVPSQDTEIGNYLVWYGKSFGLKTKMKTSEKICSSREAS